MERQAWVRARIFSAFGVFIAGARLQRGDVLSVGGIGPV